MRTATFLLGLLVMLAAPASAQVQRIQSTPQRVTLLELYTSEGCSSCPPADRWVSDLKQDPRLWTSLVPVAFHVDYWDYIGWPDRFADPASGRRQRDHARLGGLSSVYTPGFVVHGDEWRAWFRYPVLELDNPPPAGVIVVEVAAAKGAFEASYTAAQASPQPLDLHLAVLGFDLQTRVQAGENEGRTLRHDFVVLGHSRIAMSGSSPRFAATGTLPPLRAQTPRRALAAWVSRRGHPRPLQAAGDWLR
jgi:hypothetical protein